MSRFRMWSMAGLFLCAGGSIAMMGMLGAAAPSVASNGDSTARTGARPGGAAFGGPPTATVSLNTANACVTGNQLVVTIDMTNAPVVIVGGQFFLEYDNAVLEFVSIEPGDEPFTREITEAVNEVAGTIDYLVGIEDGGTGTSDDTTMAVLTFDILQDVCAPTAGLVAWRASGPNDAPNQLSDDNGDPVEIDPVDLGAVRIDGEAPQITCPPDFSVQCADDVAAPYADLTAFLTAGGTVDDNCDESLTFSLESDSGLVGGSCGGTVTRVYRVTDDCGNSDECTHIITVDDTTNPSITCPANANLQCLDDVPAPDFAGGSADDNCDATPTVTHEGDQNNGGSGCLGDPLIITRTYRATDDCGNFMECQQAIAVEDDTPPALDPCPVDIHVDADAGGCSAVVTFTLPGATDNCDPSPTVTADPPSGSTFPSGTTTVTVTAEDSCGNPSQCTFDVIVDAGNLVAVTVQLGGGVVSAGPFTRAITFELWNTTVSANAPLHTTCEEIEFSGGMGSTTLVVPCNAAGYTCITARDRLHTLRRTMDPIPISGTQYVSAFTAVNGNKDLTGGNLNDDKFIDILDFGIYTTQDLAPVPGGADTTCLQPPPARHADVNGDGQVDTVDFGFVAMNALKVRDPNCDGSSATLSFGDNSPGGNYGPVPIMSITMSQLHRRGLGHIAIADLNRDGVLDVTDVELWMQGVRPLKKGNLTAPAPMPAGAERR